jgi:septal ring factor EnvC (AmiA/AmiB activator)
MSKAQVPDHIEKRFREVEKERRALEDELQGHQEELRKVRAERADHPEATNHLARVNDVKSQIATLSFEHAELARMRATLLGGKNYTPPPG